MARTNPRWGKAALRRLSDAELMAALGEAFGPHDDVLAIGAADPVDPTGSVRLRRYRAVVRARLRQLYGVPLSPRIAALAALAARRGIAPRRFVTFLAALFALDPLGPP